MPLLQHIQLNEFLLHFDCKTSVHVVWNMHPEIDFSDVECDFAVMYMHQSNNQPLLLQFFLFLRSIFNTDITPLPHILHSSPQGNQGIPRGTIHWPRVLTGKGDPPTPGSHVQSQHWLWVELKGNPCSGLYLWIKHVLVPLVLFIHSKVLWSFGSHLVFGW